MANKKEKLEFFRGETYSWTESVLKYAGVIQDVSLDTVQFLAKESKKDTDAEAIIKKTDVLVDVATDGVNGNITFTLPKEITNIAPKLYYGEATWISGTQEKVVREYDVVCKERVEDVPGT